MSINHYRELVQHFMRKYQDRLYRNTDNDAIKIEISDGSVNLAWKPGFDKTGINDLRLLIFHFHLDIENQDEQFQREFQHLDSLLQGKSKDKITSYQAYG